MVTEEFITGIKQVSIPVANQDRALKFYTEKLGFKLMKDVPMGPGMRWIELQIPGAETQIVLFTPEGQESHVGTFSNIILSAKDVQATYNTLKARGVEFTTPPTVEPWGTYAILKDSEGNSFCLSSDEA